MCGRIIDLPSVQGSELVEYSYGLARRNQFVRQTNTTSMMRYKFRVSLGVADACEQGVWVFAQIARGTGKIFLYYTTLQYYHIALLLCDF